MVAKSYTITQLAIDQMDSRRDGALFADDCSAFDHYLRVDNAIRADLYFGVDEGGIWIDYGYPVAHQLFELLAPDLLLRQCQLHSIVDTEDLFYLIVLVDGHGLLLLPEDREDVGQVVLSLRIDRRDLFESGE